jgi:hypothetical protein
MPSSERDGHEATGIHREPWKRRGFDLRSVVVNVEAA